MYGVRLVSSIVIVVLVATIGPAAVPKTDTVNVCEPSVLLSAVVEVLNDPTLSTILNDPDVELKSPAAVVI